MFSSLKREKTKWTKGAAFRRPWSSSALNRRAHDLLHEGRYDPAQGGVVEQRLARAQVAVEVPQQLVGVPVPRAGHVAQPALHQAIIRSS